MFCLTQPLNDTGLSGSQGPDQLPQLIFAFITSAHICSIRATIAEKIEKSVTPRFLALLSLTTIPQVCGPA